MIRTAVILGVVALLVTGFWVLVAQHLHLSDILHGHYDHHPHRHISGHTSYLHTAQDLESRLAEAAQHCRHPY